MPAILLVAINAKWIHPSLALRLLKANLGEYEDQAEIREFALRQPLEEKIEPILAARPRILGLSVSIWNHRQSLELLEALESRWAAVGTRPVVILGGPEVSFLPPLARLFHHADYVIRGEGEEVFRQLCAAILREGGAANPARLSSAAAVSGKFINAHPVDLAVIKSGYRLYREEDLSRKLIYVEASRGCPFGCEFCQGSFSYQGSFSCQDSQARQVREFPLEPFLADMETLSRRGERSGQTPLTFKFLDRTFNLNIERARRIMEFFLEKIKSSEGKTGQGKRPLCVHFEMVPSRFPAELREILSRFPPGSLRLEIGIQTLNAEVSSRICRPGAGEEDLETLRFLREKTSAVIHADLIAGLPGETMASFAEGFDRLWAALAVPGETAQRTPFEIQCGILKLLPGAPIARHSGAFGMAYSPDPPYEVMETAALSSGDLDRLKNFARFWELLVNRGLIFPKGQRVFDAFLALSDSLLARFGRNWGIDRGELFLALGESDKAGDFAFTLRQ